MSDAARPDLTTELLQAILTASDAAKTRALRVLRGGTPVDDLPRLTEPFLTLKEAARRLNVSACSLWRWGVPGHQLGGRRKFRMSEIEAYLTSPAFEARVAQLRETDRERRRSARRDQS